MSSEMYDIMGTSSVTRGVRKMKNSTLLVIVGALAAAHGSAQVTGTGGRGATAPTTGTGGTAGQTTAPSNQNTGAGAGTSAPNVSRPVFISGKVAMQDGLPVPPNVTIQRICGGASTTVAYTDSKGRFSFQWGDRNTVVADASDAGFGSSRNAGSFGGAQSSGGANGPGSDPLGSRMMNCELRANVSGYTSDVVNLYSRRSVDSPDIGLIVLHRIAGVEGSSVSITSMMAPKEAKKAYERGLQLQLKNKPDDALKDFEKAVAIYPAYAEAWMNVGKLRLEKHDLEPARAALQKAIEADSKLVAPYVELGLLAAREAKWQESGRYLDRAVRLDPVDFPQAWYADAVANYNLRNYDVAERSAREAKRLDPRHANPRSGYLLGLVLAEKKDYAGAAVELTAFIELAPNAPDATEVKEQLRKLEKLRADASGTVPAAQP